MTSFLATCFGRSRTLLSLLALLLIFGSISYQKIPKESFPDIQIPMIFVVVTLEGISPKDSESLLVKPLETPLRSLEGLKEMKADAFQGGCHITLEFKAGLDIDQALYDVRQKVQEVKADLPLEAEEPVVKELNLSQFPVLSVMLHGDVPYRTLTRTADALKDSIEQQVPSVLKTTLVGYRKEVGKIIVDSHKLLSYPLSLMEVIGLFKRHNALISAGNMEKPYGLFPVQIDGLFKSVEDIMRAPLYADEKKVVRLQDIAKGRRTFKDATGHAFVNGHAAVVIDVSKRTGENIIETVAKVKEVTERFMGQAPQGMKITFAQDQSDEIIERLDDLENNVILAVLLVMMVIALSLGFKSSLLVGLAVPGAFLMGILCLSFMGLTVNMIVLFSLILSVGMLVDGAVIVVEYADQHINQGVSPKQAFLKAATKMFWPVVTSTITIILAFAPLLFWPGVVGEFMKFMPMTLIATLFGSLLMALIFLPTLGRVFYKKKPIQDPKNQRPESFQRENPLKQAYGVLLRRAINAPWIVMAVFGGLLTVIILLYGTLGKGADFFPKVEPTLANLTLKGTSNMSVKEREALVKKVEEKLLLIPDIQTVYTNTDLSTQSAKEDTLGFITLEFKPWQKRRRADVIMAHIQDLTESIPHLSVMGEVERGGPGKSKPIDVRLSSQNAMLLEKVFKNLKRSMGYMPAIKDMEDTGPYPGLQWSIHVDRDKALSYGLDIQTIGAMIQMVTRGYKVGTFQPEDSQDKLDILLRFQKKDRHLQGLKDLMIPTPQGPVPLSNMATQAFTPKQSTIHRIDGQRTYQIKADVHPGFLVNDAIKEVRSWIDTHGTDPGLFVSFGGDEADQKETSDFLGGAFLMVMCLIFLVLLVQFNTFSKALIVLSAVFFSILGVLIGLMVMGQTFNIVMTGLGIVSLAGIIVSNNILLIDTFQEYYDQQRLPLQEAVWKTGMGRVRAVLLTQITTVLGLLPMILRMNIDFFKAKITFGAPSSDMWVHLSTAIAFGVTFATLLTLVMTPCLLILTHRKTERQRQKQTL